MLRHIKKIFVILIFLITSLGKAKPPVAIITCDGGGMRGLIELKVLEALQHNLGFPLVDVVKVWTGVSVGAINVSGLNVPEKEGSLVPKCNPSDILKLFFDDGMKIFPKGWWNNTTSAYGVYSPTYSEKGIEEVFKKYFENTPLSHAINNVLIPGFNTTNYEPIFFKSSKAKQNKSDDFLMRDVLRVTTSAQTYFPVPKIVSIDGKCTVEGIDGGSVVNNPTMSALAEAYKLFPENQFLVISLGTGRVKKTLEYNKIKHQGALSWLTPTIDIAINGSNDVIDYQMNQLFKQKEHSFYLENDDKEVKHNMYYRFQPFLPEECGALDDASPENLKKLGDIADTMIKEKDKEIQEIVDVLKKIKAFKKEEDDKVLRL